MADQWMHAGGAAWLDAVLYDGALSEADVLLGDDGLRREATATTAEAEGVVDRSASSPLGLQPGT
jgi:hypothetical protein